MDPSVTIDLRLTPEELEDLYRRMVDIGIEDYPSDFRPADTGSIIRPAAGMEPQYRLRLRVDGRELVLTWSDEYSSGAAEATALRTLFEGFPHTLRDRHRVHVDDLADGPDCPSLETGEDRCRASKTSSPASPKARRT